MPMGCLDSPVQGVELGLVDLRTEVDRGTVVEKRSPGGRAGGTCAFFYVRRVLPVTPLGLGEIYHPAPGNLLAL
jgi:hypothetical protein